MSNANGIEAGQADARGTARRKKKFALALGAFIGVSLIAGALLLRANQPANIVIPPPAPLPKPNAYDFYVKAGNMTKPANSVFQLEDPPPQLVAEALRDNAPALRTLRQGFAFPFRYPPQRDMTAWNFALLGKSRELARHLVIESRAREKRGDHGGAMQSRLDGLRMFGDLPRGGIMIHQLAGSSSEDIVRRDILKISSRLSAPQSRAAAKRLETIYENRVPFVEIVREEKWTSLTTLKKYFAGPNWREKMRLDFERAGENKYKDKFAQLDAHALAKNCIEITDIAIANARLPYAAPQKPMPRNLDLYNALSAPYFRKWQLTFAGHEATNAMFFVGLALQAFRLENGSYPATLRELAPSYLARVPADPFGRGETLRYKRKTEREYSLYSIGPDGRDNGGQAVQENKVTRQSVFSDIDAKARGDLVFDPDPSEDFLDEYTF